MIITSGSDSWWYYYNQYKTLTDKLIKEDRSLIADGLITLPFLYYMRHTLELGFKASIIDLSKDDNSLKDTSHELVTLFQLYEAMLLSAIDDIKVIEKVKSELKMQLQQLGSFISYFAALDKHSLNFRYPSTKKGVPSFNEGTSIDENKMIFMYQKTIGFLSHATSIFCDRYYFYDDFNT